MRFLVFGVLCEARDRPAAQSTIMFSFASAAGLASVNGFELDLEVSEHCSSGFGVLST